MVQYDTDIQGADLHGLLSLVRDEGARFRLSVMALTGDDSQVTEADLLTITGLIEQHRNARH